MSSFPITIIRQSVWGGLINAGPLKGTAFGPGGTPYAFQYGQDVNATTMSGGDAQAVNAEEYAGRAALNGSTKYNLYTRASYDLTSSFSLKADFLYANIRDVSPEVPYSGTPTGGNLTILKTNAFLPASIVSQMTAAGVTSFTLGRADTDFGGPVTAHTNTQSYWGGLSGHGTLGDTWSYDVFYNYGATHLRDSIGLLPIKNLFTASIASVISPTTGQPVCSDTSQVNPNNGATCVPVNLFGYGSPSAAAVNYFSGTSSRYWTLAQNEAGATVRGEPFSTWAGPVSIATGMEWRTESMNVTVDPISAISGFYGVNQAGQMGHYSVTEGFFETVVPLLRDVTLAKQFDFNGAVRESSYSTSGAITAWKFGLTDHVNDELLVRGTLSQDIRAPNLQEAYATSTAGTAIVLDPKNANASVNVITTGGGNPNLSPELAHTITYGFVYSPDWLSNFSVSADWFGIAISNAITTLAAQTEINYCANGVTAACAGVTRNAAGVITGVASYALNLAKLGTSGVDLELTHHFDLSDLADSIPGSLSSHLATTYVSKIYGFDGTILSQGLANLSGTSTAPSQLRWRSVLTETYSLDPAEAFVRLRYLSGGFYNPALSIDQNYVGSQLYFDLGASYFVTPDHILQAYANVTNVGNRQPPTIGALSTGFYDVFGRTFNVGLRASL